MAAAPKNTFAKGPWMLKKNDINNFTRITEINREKSKAIGRIYYVIEQIGTHYVYKGCFTVDPCLMKGWWQWPFMPFAAKPKEISNKTHFRVFIDADKRREDWAAEYKALIDKFILSGELYIKLADPLLTYIKE